MSALQPDRRYNAVATGGNLFEAGTGTLGYQVHMKAGDAEIETEYVIWLSNKESAKERALRDFETLGIGPEYLKSPAKIREIGAALAGRELGIRTKAETYKDKTTVKVTSIGKKFESPSSSPEAVVARMFGATAAESADDDDVPF